MYSDWGDIKNLHYETTFLKEEFEKEEQEKKDKLIAENVKQEIKNGLQKYSSYGTICIL